MTVSDAEALADLKQENSLLRSQFANCHKEIGRLRENLLRYTASSDVAICVACGKPAIGKCELA